MTANRPAGRPPVSPPVTVTVDADLGLVIARRRPPGPAGADTLRLPGIVARIDVAQPEEFLDAALIQDDNTHLTPAALEILELLAGPHTRDLAETGREGEAPFDPPHGPRRQALLCLAHLQPATDVLQAAEAVLQATRATAKLTEWTEPLARSAAETLDAVLTDPPYNPTATHAATVLLAATREPAPIASPDLDQAIAIAEQTISGRASGDPRIPDRLDTLNRLLLQRWLQDHRREDLDRAVDLAEEAVAATAPEHPGRPYRLDTLRSVLEQRWHEDRSPADLERAIDLAQQAVAATPAGHPSRERLSQNLEFVSNLSDLNDTGSLDQIWTEALATLPARSPVPAGAGLLIDPTGMPLPPGLLDGPVKLEHDGTHATLSGRVRPDAASTTIWVQIANPDGEVTFAGACTYDNEGRSFHVDAIAIGNPYEAGSDGAWDYFATLTIDPSLAPIVPADRHHHTAETFGRAARRLLDALTADRPTATAAQWSKAAHAWADSAETWERSEPPDQPRAALAYTLAALCAAQAGDQAGAAIYRSNLDTLEPGWATEILPDQIPASPGPHLSLLARPLLDSWAQHRLAELAAQPPDNNPEAAIKAIDRLATSTGTHPEAVRMRTAAQLTLTELAANLGQTQLAARILHHIPAQLTQAAIPATDPTWHTYTHLHHRLQEEQHEHRQ